MRRTGLPLRRIVLSFLVAAATLAGAAGLTWAEPASQVIALRGTATLERGRSRLPLAAGTELAMGDWVETDAGARVKLRFADGSLVQLGENTRLRIDQAKFDQAEGRRNILLDMPLGLLRAAAAKLTSTSGSSFEIHTGIGYSAVRGTEWIMVAASEETRVYVTEGRVSVGTDFPSAQFPKLVQAGYWVVVRKTGIETIEASPPGSLDSLMEQTEAAVTDSAPAGDAETAETETDSVSDASDAVTDVTDNAVDPANANGSATTTGTGADSSAPSGGTSTSPNSNSSPNNSPNKTSNGGSSGSSSGGGGSSSGGGGSGSNGGSSNSGGGGKGSGGGLGGKSGGSNKLK
ncbi:FecR family protein [Dongia sp. agr-C8]